MLEAQICGDGFSLHTGHDGGAQFEKAPQAQTENRYPAAAVANKPHQVEHPPGGQYREKSNEGPCRDASSSDFDEEWNWYLAQENINCFYFISDVVVVHSMLQAFGDDLIEVQKKMHRELNLVADELIQFASQFFDALLRKYFSPEIIAEVVEKIEGAPVALDVQLPFYVEPPSDDRLTEDGFIKEGH
jgi:hypothetical protein